MKKTIKGKERKGKEKTLSDKKGCGRNHMFLPQPFVTKFYSIPDPGAGRSCRPLDKLLGFNGFGEFRHELQDIFHNTHISHLKNRGFGVFVHCHDKRVSLDPAQVLKRP
jgi:hypothetical protein